MVANALIEPESRGGVIATAGPAPIAVLPTTDEVLVECPRKDESPGEPGDSTRGGGDRSGIGRHKRGRSCLCIIRPGVRSWQYQNDTVMVTASV